MVHAGITANITQTIICRSVTPAREPEAGCNQSPDKSEGLHGGSGRDRHVAGNTLQEIHRRKHAPRHVTWLRGASSVLSSGSTPTLPRKGRGA